MDLTSAKAALASLARRSVSEEEKACALQLLPALSGATAETETESSASALALKEGLLTLAASPDCWESRAAGFLACSEALAGPLKDADADELVEQMSALAESNLEHKEPRVRSSVCKLLEVFARRDGAKTWARFGPVLCDIVDKSFDLDLKERECTHAELAAQESAASPAASPAAPSPASTSKTAISADAISLLVHETIGWKALETSMRGLQGLVRGYGAAFVADGHLAWRDEYLLKLVTGRALSHENRYVREVGYHLCAEIALALCSQTEAQTQTEAGGSRSPGAPRSAQTDALAAAIAKGLSDNWSQVRYAASVAARNLMLGLSAAGREAYLEVLVPRMCLNRYYLAQGVRIYNQATWELVFGADGVAVVEAHMAAVSAYYCLQSRADNHGVREAACHSIAELSVKAGAAALGPHVAELLAALVDCFKDESWPVRDAACVASGDFVLQFPKESAARLEELYVLWFDHLSDNIWSVREDSAVALGSVMKAYPEDAVARVKAALPDMLKKVLEPDPGFLASKPAPSKARSSSGSTSSSSSSSAPRVMAGAESQPRGIVQGSLVNLHQTRNAEGGAGQAQGGAQREGGAHGDSHGDGHGHGHADDYFSNQQLFSCGSLAPKLKRKGVGCMDHGYARPKRNWEVTDGGIYLLRELTALHPSEGASFLAALAEVCDSPAARGVPELRVTLWKQLVPVARALGKRPFKQHLEPLLPGMIGDLKSDSQLVASAAADCIEFLREWLGQGIFKGRVQGLMDGQRLWDTMCASTLLPPPSQP